MAKLKVFRTAIGFHDAYVAAPSRAAALRAWGADSDLFAMGSAELVTDERLAAPALEQPGTVIRVSRGSEADHLGSFGKAAKASTRNKPATAKPKPKPRPSRSKLDAAEKALETARTDHDAALADIDRRIEALRSERKALDARFAPRRKQLEGRRDEAQADHDRAMEAWRASD